MKKLTILGISLALLFNFQTSKAQDISTYAGDGVAGFSGDGGQATVAELHGPFHLNFDNSGNLIVPDYDNQRIRLINSSGVISTIAGSGVAGYYGNGGPATAAELYNPSGACVDASGNIYIVEHDNYVIRKVNTSGIISTVVGNGISGYYGDGGQATAAELARPIGVTVNAGIIYITDAGNASIREVNTSGVISTIAGNSLIAGFSGDGGPATAAEINWPADILIGASGDIIFSDWNNDCVRKINTSGIISTISGIGTVSGYSGDGGPATAAEMNLPNGLNKDAAGNLYLSDEGNNCIRKVNTSGIITLVAGNTVAGFSGDGGAATAAELYECVGVAVNSAGHIFIADYGNNRVREVIPSTEGIDNIAGTDNAVLVYPNPAKELIYVQIQNSEKSQKVILYTITGQKVLENNSEGKETMEISTSGLSNGVYFVTVLMTDGSSIVKKIEVIK